MRIPCLSPPISKSHALPCDFEGLYRTASQFRRALPCCLAIPKGSTALPRNSEAFYRAAVLTFAHIHSTTSQARSTPGHSAHRRVDSDSSSKCSMHRDSRGDADSLHSRIVPPSMRYTVASSLLRIGRHSILLVATGFHTQHCVGFFIWHCHQPRRQGPFRVRLSESACFL